MKIGILEDEKEVSDKIREYILRYFESSDTQETLEITVYLDAYELLENYTADFDVLFMDIQLGLMTGMEAAGRIRETDPRVLIVFVTNLAQYAVDGYQVNAYDFILKPVGYKSFSMKLARIVRELEHRRGGVYLSLKTKGGYVRLNVARIVYVEVRSHDLIYHAGEDTYLVRDTMKNAAAKLGGMYFALCNNCYLVNLAHVKKANKTVLLSNGEELPISQGRRKEFLSELAKYMGGTI